MPGLQGMKGAETDGNSHRHQGDAETQLRSGDQFGERAARSPLTVDFKTDRLSTRPNLP